MKGQISYSLLPQGLVTADNSWFYLLKAQWREEKILSGNLDNVYLVLVQI